MTPKQFARRAILERQKKEKEAFLEHLRQFPIIQYACERANIGRASFYRWRDSDEKFKRAVEDAMAEGVSFINDLTESQLIQLIKQKKLPAIALWLRHRHTAFKRRDGDEVPSPVTFNIVKY